MHRSRGYKIFLTAKMKKYLIFAATILATNIFVYSQRRFTAEELSNMVVCVVDNSVRPQIAGTAIIISDSSKFYLVTASHVVDSIKGVCFLVFRVGNDMPVSVQLDKFTGGKPGKWIRHQEADVSVLEITPFNDDTRSRLISSHFPLNQIHSEKEAISRDMDVMALGFPVVDFIGNHFSPLTFKSSFSSGLVSMKRADTKTISDFQLLENPSVQGYSGGPVLIGLIKGGVMYGPDRTWLVGIVHGTFFDNTGGKLAMITPAYYILDILKR